MPQEMRPTSFEASLNIIINEIIGHVFPFIFVLDDFHIIHSKSVLKILSYLLEHLPPQMHLVILYRIDHSLPLARMRARNRLMDIRVDQLRFTRDEIAVFLNDVMGLALSADDLSALEIRTEGWIASLQLAALSMRSSHDIHGFVSAFTGSHHYVMDYLVEEVIGLSPRRWAISSC